MFNFARNILLNRNLLFIIERSLCKKPPTFRELPRSNPISAAINLFLLKSSRRDKLIANEREEFEFGKRYLSKMMGLDPDTLTQDDINEAIRYLFPSGLAEPQARPVMTDPVNIYPVKKQLECNKYGRPHNSLYYTARPAFYSMMLDGVYLLESLKSMEDRVNRNETVKGRPLDIFNTVWMTEKQLSQYLSEKVSPLQYQSWLNLMNAILKHPYSSEAESFLLKMRVSLKGITTEEIIIEPKTDPDTGRKYIESYAQKKWTMTEVKLYMPGEGKLSINGKTLIEAVPLISNREAILFPLQFTDTIGKVDIIATAKVSGSSNLALSLRLAISRALAGFLSKEIVVRMRLAGLLTQDDRYKERKQPGQPKARKKAVWRKR